MGLSIGHLLVILAIVLVIFGTKKLRDFGGDLGGAIRNFRASMKDENEKQDAEEAGKETHKISKQPGKVIEGKVTAKQTSRAKKKA